MFVLKILALKNATEECVKKYISVKNAMKIFVLKNVTNLYLKYSATLKTKNFRVKK